MLNLIMRVSIIGLIIVPLLQTPSKAGDVGYVLKCSRMHEVPFFISRLRQKYLEQNYTFKVSDRKLVEEVHFYQQRISTYSPIAAKSMEQLVLELFSKIDFLPDLRLQREALRLPETINGCETVPIFTKLDQPLPSGKLYLGDLDHWNKLTALDQSLVLLELSESLPRHALLFSEQLPSLSLQNFYKLFHVEWAKDKVPVTFNGIDLFFCKDWWTPSIPSQCLVYPSQLHFITKQTDGTLNPNDKISFHPNGVIAKVNIQDLKLIGTNHKIICKNSLEVFFDDKGLLHYCHGFEITSSNHVIYDSYSDAKVFLKAKGERQESFYKSVVRNSRDEPVYGILNTDDSKTLASYFPRNYFPVENYHNLFGLHPNYHFRSGILHHYDQNKRLIGTYYLETNNEGKITRKLKIRFQSTDGLCKRNNPSNCMLHIYNDADAEKVIVLKQDDDLESKIIFADLDVFFREPTNCKVELNAQEQKIYVGPKCKFLARIIFAKN